MSVCPALSGKVFLIGFEIPSVLIFSFQGKKNARGKKWSCKIFTIRTSSPPLGRSVSFSLCGSRRFPPPLNSATQNAFSWGRIWDPKDGNEFLEPHSKQNLDERAAFFLGYDGLVCWIIWRLSECLTKLGRDYSFAIVFDCFDFIPLSQVVERLHPIPRRDIPPVLTRPMFTFFYYLHFGSLG